MHVNWLLKNWNSKLILLLPFGITAGLFCLAQTPAETDALACMRTADGEATLSKVAAAGEAWRFEMSKDMQSWDALHTAQNSGAAAGTLSYLDTGAPYRDRRFYRAVPVGGSGVVTGDQIQTNDGIVTIKPIYHASFYLHWARSSGTTIIYSDPSSQGAPAGRFTGLPKADMVLITHRHGDHLNTANLDAIRNGTATKIIASADTYAGLGTNTLGTTLKSMTTIFKTGQAVATDNSAPLNLLGVTIEGVPAYNSNHVKGNCNSYIITIGGKRIYISGDTGAITEMNAMTNIDVAFLCINVPFTMTVAEAAASTRTFKPKIVYPYHLRNSDNTYSDVGLFKTTVGRDLEIEVRNRNWY